MDNGLPESEGHQPQPQASAPDPAQAGESKQAGASSRRRWIIGGVAGAVVLGVGLFFGIRWLHRYLNTVSTNDAYVQNHVTYVGPRVESQVLEVLVDETDQVTVGQVLVRLDAEPFRVTLEQKQAALDVAQAQLEQARANVRAGEAQARGDWFAVVAAQEHVQDLVAQLRSAVAARKVNESELDLAQKDYDRAVRLFAEKAMTAVERDRELSALQVARDQVAQAEDQIQQIRAELGLPPDTEHPTTVPDDLAQEFSGVQTALSQWALSVAEIGLSIKLYGMTPEQMHDQFQKLAPGGDFNAFLNQQVEQAPAVVLARAQVESAQRDVDDARLKLSYTEIKSTVAGYVSNRTVNPGDDVQSGQRLMAVWPLEEAWIDANFKETALDQIVIGLPVKVYVDAYPGHVFAGRVAGFSPATGASLALLPPENATGNWVKVVQRLPVRITFTEPIPPETPLFTGLSATPVIDIHAQPTGPNAGRRLRSEPGAVTPSGQSR